MDLEQAKSLAILPATPAFGLAPFDLKFYAGTEHLKLKAVDRMTGASFTAVYLCPTFSGQPMQRQLALDIAALACAAPKMLAALTAIYNGPAWDHLTAEQQVDIVEAMSQARRSVPTVGILSPEVEAAIKKHAGQ